ncbi:MAG: DUF5610 domain-containing protein [Planctomycetes bacterium]|nr:DUF5610 domain-containing protein [Planctomycetota bacterium]
MVTGITNPGVSQLLDSLGMGNNPLSNLFANSKAGRGFNPHSLGETDQVELSPEASILYQHTRAQFELNYQCVRCMSGPDGKMYEEVNFSFKGSYEFLRATTGVEPFTTADLQETSFIEKLQELYSPENTAERILNFALSQYSKFGEEDTEAARQEFADYIGKAIQEGFDSALAILGDIAENIRAGIDKTHELVFQGLADFIANGRPEATPQVEDEEAVNNAYAELWQASVQIQYSHLRISSYNSRGQIEASADTTDASEPFEAMA